MEENQLTTLYGSLMALFTLCSIVIVCHINFGDAITDAIDEMYLGWEGAVVYDGHYLNGRTRFYSFDAENLEYIGQELYDGVRSEALLWGT